MIIPYSTDTPLHHWPFVTCGLIVTNVVVFCMTTLSCLFGQIEFDQISWLMLMPDQINPLQWVTCIFMHGDPLHLISNLFFLFVFGLIVEGKAGSTRFALIYLGIGTIVSAVSQVGMFVLGSEAPMLGASGVVAGLMMIALLWAPDNDVFWLFLVWRFETAIAIFALYFIALDLMYVIFSGLVITGAFGHILGATLGFFAGGYLLRTEQVDCDGWDAVSRHDWLKQYRFLYSDKQRQRDALLQQDDFSPVTSALQLEGCNVDHAVRYGSTSLPEIAKSNLNDRKQREAKRKAEGNKPKRRYKRIVKCEGAERTAKSQSHPEFNRLAYVLRSSLKAGNLVEAMRHFRSMDSQQLAHGLSESTLMEIAKKLGAAKQWTDAVRPLVVLTEKKESMADEARLLMARIQLQVMKRRDLAIKTLEEIQTPDPESNAGITASTQNVVRRRDQLLQQLRQTA
ncbi:rhomboid family intramembrane serine protease [Roseiconus lacunae]|uniref:rhomboid family intramembrane serine protease n=1 Tax=Roseiconus lacunae TaxID=2605694 RepID=UPI0011F26B48|nr:rhomboid family intramembrane serine protease [Roseiconus lacunae]MCD0459839.1 rhomboid family intramembrane serine protease [Roseiconus lacunae]